MKTFVAFLLAALFVANLLTPAHSQLDIKNIVAQVSKAAPAVSATINKLIEHAKTLIALARQAFRDGYNGEKHEVAKLIGEKYLLIVENIRDYIRIAATIAKKGVSVGEPYTNDASAGPAAKTLPSKQGGEDVSY